MTMLKVMPLFLEGKMNNLKRGQIRKRNREIKRKIIQSFLCYIELSSIINVLHY
jgi:hypothetical protein